MGDQGSGLGFDGLMEWQNVVLSRPTEDVMDRGMETEEFL